MYAARYQRHLTLKDFGKPAQRRLNRAHIAIVGVGGLGSAAALYLTAAGIGTLTLIDGDFVDESNLQRQILYRENDIGRPKVEAAQENLQARNHALRIHAQATHVSSRAEFPLMRNADVILDCTDNFNSRFLLNEYSVHTQQPLVVGACTAYAGQATTFDRRNKNTPCYACLYPPAPSEQDIPPEHTGILSPLPGIIGAIQGVEAIKIVTGVGLPLIGRLWTLDARTLASRVISFAKDPYCPVCGSSSADIRK